MSIVFVDSFDHYQTADIEKKWTSLAGSPAIGATGRTVQALECGVIEGAYRGVSTAATYVMGMAFKTTAFNVTNGTIVRFGDTAGSAATYIVATSSGAIALYYSLYSIDVGATAPTVSTTLIATSSAGVLTTNNWAYIEVKLTASDSTAGAYEVRVNGVPVVGPATGVRTTYNDTSYGEIGIGGTASGTTYLDDVYICDTSGSVNNDFLGDVTVECIFPQTDAVAAGTHEDFTCSTGSDQGAMVDESSSDFPDDDSTYITSSTDTHRSTFNYPDITPASADILGVQVNICAKKSDTGTRTYTSAIRSGGNDYDGETELGLTVAPSDTSYVYGTFVHEVNPDTSTAWTIGGVNGAEFGVLVTE